MAVYYKNHIEQTYKCAQRNSDFFYC